MPKATKVKRLQQKLVHPNSRKAQQIGRKQIHKNKVQERKKELSQKLKIKLDKLAWFHSNLPDANTEVSPSDFQGLIERYLHRFDDEIEYVRSIEQIRGNTTQYSGRMDAIKMTLEKDNRDYDTCGLEVPDLLNLEVCNIFREWDGSSVAYFPKIAMKMYSRAMLDKLV